MQELQIIEIKGIRVLTTKQLADAYGADVKTIQYNFRYNKNRYVLGKHYIEVMGDELRKLKTRSEIQSSLKYVKSLYLWTEKGALLHAKSLNTDKAWEIYDYLVDFYFRAKGKTPEALSKHKPVREPMMIDVVDVPHNPKILAAIRKIRNDLTAMDVLMEELIRYHSEETYKEKVRAATGIIHILVGDSSKLLNLKPQLVKKEY